MPMNRKLYPPNWDDIALEIKQEANWTCQHCSKKCLEPNQVTEAHKTNHSLWAFYTLTVHHIDHNPPNCKRENLIALCSVCHLRQHAHDKKFGIKKGQMTLL